ncbi:hypothetical protein HDU96_010639 [Phlyctochytrium bullatum]|nr:hypothetical protein HDU96_010639 [Phlyctochytrium bullatum]
MIVNLLPTSTLELFLIVEDMMVPDSSEPPRLTEEQQEEILDVCRSVQPQTAQQEEPMEV